MNGRSGGYGGYGGGGGGFRRHGNDPGPRPPMPEVEFPEGSETTPPEPGSGVLELHPNGYGFLRSISNNLSRERTDPFVPGTMIEKFRLREGVLINGMVQHSRRQQGPAVEGNPRCRRHEAGRLSERQGFRPADADQSGKLAATGNRAAADHHAGDGFAHAASARASGR